VITNDNVPLFLVDAKYKPLKLVPDRSDLNQVLLYGARYSCSKVMVLYPERPTNYPSLVKVGTVGSVSVYNGHIDLAATNIRAEERAFGAAVFSLVGYS
jgi:5-methylcytosine-specific restriction enzyme subunit McrC